MKKEYRIKKNEEFSEIISKKKIFSNEYYKVYAANRKLDHSRIGISVSKKIGNAVVRNKIKRQIRMMLIENYDFANSMYDLIIIIKDKYLKIGYVEASKYLEMVIKKVII